MLSLLRPKFACYGDFIDSKNGFLLKVVWPQYFEGFRGGDEVVDFKLADWDEARVVWGGFYL